MPPSASVDPIGVLTTRVGEDVLAAGPSADHAGGDLEDRRRGDSALDRRRRDRGHEHGLAALAVADDHARPA